MAEETPAQVDSVGLGDWYQGLSSQDKVRVRRYIEGIDESSDVAFLMDLMSRASEDHNYKLAVTAGNHIEGIDLDDEARFRATEQIIEGMFGCDMFEEAKAMCLRNLDLYPKVVAAFPPESHLCCRNRLIDIMVGVFADYDGAFAVLDRYVEMGLIDAEERDYRVQSLKVHRMQQSFDNIFNYTKTERRPSTGSSGSRRSRAPRTDGSPLFSR